MTNNVMPLRLVAIALTVFVWARPAIAEQCPDALPEDSGLRRQNAKKWFTAGEDATKAGDHLAALKAYQCSLKLVPHGFTAFNIGQIAERVGDLELAVASYNQYLLLVPDAQDAQEIHRKIASLKERLARVRQEEKPAVVSKPVPRPVESTPASAVDESEAPEPSAGTVSKQSSQDRYRTWTWISYGGGAAFILGGVITNLMARNKMDACRTKYGQNDRSGADAACSDAKPLAYTSYALFGVGGAALAAGTLFLVLHTTESTEAALAPLPEGGLAFGWRGSF